MPDIFHPQKLTNEEVDRLEADFNLALTDEEAREVLWSRLDDYFSANSRDDWNFRHTYWRWFAILSLRMIEKLEEKSIVDIIVKRAVPILILSDVDFLKELMLYFNDHSNADYYAVEGQKKLPVLFTKMRSAFLSSEAVIGVWREKAVSVAETVEQFKLIKSFNYDSIRVAEFEGTLKKIMFPKSEADPLFEKYFTADFDSAIKRFTLLLDFFLTVQPDEILDAIEQYLAPVVEETALPAARNEKPTVIPNLIRDPDVGEIASPPRAGRNDKPSVIPSVLSGQALSKAKDLDSSVAPQNDNVGKPSIADIKKQIDTQFIKDMAGNYEDIAGVLEKLSELAQKYNDPNIAELLYFDEKQEKFIWQV